MTYRLFLGNKAVAASPSPTGRALVGLNLDGGIFKNLLGGFHSWQASGGTYAFPGILDDDGYPTGTPTSNIFGVFDVPSFFLASDQLVIKWQGTGNLNVGRGAPGFTVVSDPGSVVVGGTGFNLNVSGTNGKVVFTFTNSIPDSVTFSFLNSGTFSGLANVVICQLSDETSIDNATIAEDMFFDEFVDILLTANPKTLRMLGWNNVNGGNNVTEHSQRKNWLTSYGFRTVSWIPGKWGGTASGTNTYACAAATDTPGSHTLGEVIQCQFTNANTSTTVTLNVGSRGAKSVKAMTGAALAVGAIAANVLGTCIYDDLLDCWLYMNDGLQSYMPLEYQVAICNLVNCNLWINYPPHILNASVSSMANYISANLNSNLTCYHEYCNEVWNFAFGFPQTTWAQNCGITLGFPSGSNRYHYGWYALRVRQIMSLVTAEGGNYKRVIAFQGYGPTGTGGSTNVYRFQGTDLDTTLGYTRYNSYVGVSYNAAPNRPIDYCDTISYATYYSGAQCSDFDANYSSTNISGLTNAADLYDTGTALNIATAFAFLDNDIRSGTRSAVLWSQTVDYQEANIYPAWETVIASYDAYRDSVIRAHLTNECYEGAMECAPPSTAQCTTMGISTTYGGSTGLIANLLNGYKQDVLFYNLVTDQFDLLISQTHSVTPAWLHINPSGNQWAMTISGTDITASKFQSWDAFVSLTRSHHLIR